MLYRIDFYSAGETARDDYFAPHPYSFCSPLVAMEIGERLCHRWCFDGYRVMASDGREVQKDDIEPMAHVSAYRRHAYENFSGFYPF